MADQTGLTLEHTPATPSPSLFSLAGKHVLITGATRGIGSACALALAQAGARCCLVVRPGHEGDAGSHPALKALKGTSTDHTTIEADLSDMEQVGSAFGRALRAMDERIDILVNCGGIQRRHPAVDFPLSDWQEVIDVNLNSVFILCQAAGRHMLPRRQGKIINFCSLLSEQGGLTVPAYAASKAAVANITRSLSNEWAKHNVNVNGITPGMYAVDENRMASRLTDVLLSHQDTSLQT